MRQPIPLRPDYDATRLRRIARESEDADQVRRLLALAVIYEGGSRTEAAEVGGVTLQVVRDWVLRFNAHGPEGLIDRKAPGQPSRLNDEHRAALAAMVENGPIPAVHEVVRWRIIDLCQWLWEEYEISVSKQTLSRELRAMGYRKLSARPRHHAQAAGAVEAFKKTGLRQWRQSRSERGLDPSNIEVWFGDEARIGQKNKITRRWARRGSRPSAPSDQRTASTYIFGAICPKRGQGRRLDPAVVQYRDDEPASRGDLRRCGPRMSCAAAGRSGRMAPLAQARRAAQHHHRSVATEMPRVEPAGKRLAVRPRQLALQPCV